jgi:hypothetical protein
MKPLRSYEQIYCLVDAPVPIVKFRLEIIISVIEIQDMDLF